MISLTNKEPLLLISSFPEGWKGRRLPGAVPYHWSGREGQLLLQQIATPQYLVRYYVLRMMEQVTLHCRRQHGLQSILSLQGNLQHCVEQLAPVHLDGGQFLLVPGGHDATIIPSGQECQVLHTYYHQNLCREFRPLFPDLEAVLKKGRDFFFPPGPRPLRSMVLDAVREQFQHHYQPPVQKAYLELKIRQTLFSLLAHDYSLSPTGVMNAHETQVVAQAYALITKDLSRHYTTAEIARHAGTNEADLKRLFRQVHGKGMFQLLQELRFARAHELLQEKHKTIKQVAQAVGYRHSTTFITEFRKYYGYTPSTVGGHW